MVCIFLTVVCLLLTIAGYNPWKVSATVGTFRYFSLTSAIPNTNRTQILDEFYDRGYTKSSKLYPTPSEVVSGLKSAKISYIHGHGNPGLIACQNSSGATIGYMYSNTLRNSASSNAYLGSLSSASLNAEQLVVYITCYSASSEGSYTSMGQETVNRGARRAIGFNNSVVQGEYWAYFLTLGLCDDRTVKSAMSYADSEYKKFNATNAADWGSPTYGHVFFGTNDFIS